MTIDRNPDHLLPRFASGIKALAIDLGADTDLEIFETFRTAERQDALFLQVPKVTNARAWQSAHQFGLGCDFARRINKVNGTDWNWDVPPAMLSLFRRRVAHYGLWTDPDGFDPLHVQIRRYWRE